MLRRKALLQESNTATGYVANNATIKCLRASTGQRLVLVAAFFTIVLFDLEEIAATSTDLDLHAMVAVEINPRHDFDGLSLHRTIFRAQTKLMPGCGSGVPMTGVTLAAS